MTPLEMNEGTTSKGKDTINLIVAMPKTPPSNL
jgi:hypothetical protein